MSKLDLLESKIKKNAHLHVMIATPVLEEMKKRAEEEDISMSEWCRRKLRRNSQLDRIESKLDKFIKS